jgi:hypothetical protein
LPELLDEATDAVVLACKAVLADQVLPDALAAQTLLQLRQDDVTERHAETGRRRW